MTKKQPKKLVIQVNAQGDCSIYPPDGMKLDEIVDILMSAVNAATDKLERLHEAASHIIAQDYIFAKKVDTDKN